MEDLILKGILDGENAFAGPEIVQFDITNRCNNNCLCCWNNSPLLGEPSSEKKKELSSELSYEIIIKTINELKEMGTKVLFFAGGGEPFMHPRIMDILKYAKDCGMRVFTNTNFTLVDSQRARALVDMKVDHIHVSVLAASGKTYAKIHPNKNEETFFMIREILKYVACLKTIKNQHLGGAAYPSGPLPHIGMHYVIFNENYHEIDEMVNLAIDVAADSVEFPLVDIVPGKTDALLLNKEQLAFVEQELKRQVKKIDLYNPTVPVRLDIINKELIDRRLDSDLAEKGKYELDIVTKQPCYVGWMFLRILADGEVNSCLKAHRVPIGNIYEQSIRDIWNNDKQKLFRQKALKHDPADAFFQLIGNDVACKFGCRDSCDNIKINIEMHNKYGRTLKDHGKIT